MDIPGWVQAAIAVASFVFAAISWWRSNLSKRAREQAEEERLRAEEHAAAARRSADSLASLAASLQRPDLTATVAGNRITVRNQSKVVQIITEVINKDDFLRLDPHNPLPITVHPGSLTTFLMVEGHGYPAPAELVLRLADRVEPVHVGLEQRHE